VTRFQPFAIRPRRPFYLLNGFLSRRSSITSRFPAPPSWANLVYLAGRGDRALCCRRADSTERGIL